MFTIFLGDISTRIGIDVSTEGIKIRKSTDLEWLIKVLKFWWEVGIG